MSNQVLYRKYRPKTFGQVVNQEHIKTTLANAVKTGRIAHAYLLTGPRGVGKTTLARIFARAINCPNRKDFEPCNECEVCRSFLEATSLDLLEIDAASHTGVDNIRELIEHLQFAPTQGQYKVIIIDEVHMLSKGAFNALLKTLEEPPKHAVFVLATTEIQKLPPTIVSRTQRFDFKRISMGDLIQHLQYVCNDNQVKIQPDALLEIAAAADGSFRDGLSLLDQVINYADGEITAELAEQVLGLTGIKTTADFLDLLIASDTQGAVDYINNLLYNGRDLYQFEKDFLEYLRKTMLVKVGAKTDWGLSQELQDRLNSQAQSLDLARLLRIIEIFQKAEGEIKWAAIQSLPLEVAAVMATSGERVAPKSSNATATVTNAPKNTDDNPDNDSSVELSTIISRWPQVLEKIKDYNHSLLSSLKLAKPVAIEGREVVVVFPYKFHRDAIDARKNRIIVDQVIEDVCGTKLMIKPIMEKDWGGKIETPVPQQTASEGLLGSALKIMGGEVEG